ncbi:MAG TPA: 2-hydroxyacid dehydrogenase [Paracoccaceae bacterium]|nr:2-hydroxyacid dehydrogenase [Paracoccaceae bacterium]
MVDILMPTPILESVEEAIERDFTLHRLWQAPDREAYLRENGPKIRGIGTFSGCDAALMDACPNLEIISVFSVGYDNVDIAQAKTRGIRVTNTPSVLDDAVAEMGLALMLALARRIPQGDAYVRAGRWISEGPAPFTAELTGATVGILGLGRIGKEFACLAQALKMRVVYHGRTEQPFQPYAYYADLEEMARDVDWLVCIAPGGKATEGIISRAVMEALGPDGYLVNIGRGSSVDEPAMIDLLQSGALGGAALDVFADEPNVPEALFALDNVILAPHQASATHKTRWAMGDLVVRNLRAHFAGEPLITRVA